MLRPQDVLVTLKLLSPLAEGLLSYAALSSSIGLSTAETHAAVRRAVRSGLLIRAGTNSDALSALRPSSPAVFDLLCHGIRYFLPAEIGPPGRGLPTATSAPPLIAQLAPQQGPPHVCPHPEGPTHGLIIEPIYRSAPLAALRDSHLAEWLALTDALRLHVGRVANLARQEIQWRLTRRTHAAAA